MENKYKVGSSDKRPWGTWKVTDVGLGYCVKTITVNPGQILSLQKHKHRREHWYVISGVGTVHLDNNNIIELKPHKHTNIIKGHWHRMENRGTEPLVFVEVQSGNILDETDIERKEDKYGR